MFTHTKIALAIGFSLASAGALATDSALFENKSFQIRSGKTQAEYGCFSRSGMQLRFLECPTPKALGGNDPIAHSLLFYKDGAIMPSETAGIQGRELCLTNASTGFLFESCNGQSTQKFAFETKDYAAGSYVIKYGQQCLAKLGDTIQIEICEPSNTDQEFTPRLMTEAIQYTAVNKNHGFQDLQLAFHELDDQVPLWVDSLRNLQHEQPQKRLIADFGSYGFPGRFILKNTLYEPLYILDNHADDITTITMPLTGREMEKTIDAPNAPIMISNVPPRPTTPTIPAPSSLAQRFRILDDVADTGFHKTYGTASFTVPEGWILNVFINTNFDGNEPRFVTSTSDTTLLKTIGSIDVIQKADSPIRAKNNDQENYRVGRIQVTPGSGESPLFFRSGDDEFADIGTKDKSSAIYNEIGSYVDNNPPKGQKNGFYILKAGTGASIPFNQRDTWEPLNIGSWHPGSGQKDELYAHERPAKNNTTIWRLKKDGALACIPDNQVSNESWEYLGVMKGGEFNTLEVSDTSEGFYIYDDRAYQGKKLKITENVADLCNFNDRMSSFKIPNGWEVRFFTGKDYTGSYYTRVGSQSYQAALDNKIKSIQILRK